MCDSFVLVRTRVPSAVGLASVVCNIKMWTTQYHNRASAVHCTSHPCMCRYENKTPARKRQRAKTAARDKGARRHQGLVGADVDAVASAPSACGESARHRGRQTGRGKRDVPSFRE